MMGAMAAQPFSKTADFKKLWKAFGDIKREKLTPEESYALQRQQIKALQLKKGSVM